MAEMLLKLRCQTVGFEDLADRVNAALEAGRFSFDTEVEPGPPEAGFLTCRVKARRLVINLGPDGAE